MYPEMRISLNVLCPAFAAGNCMCQQPNSVQSSHQAFQIQEGL
jgi:hypothetical protein